MGLELTTDNTCVCLFVHSTLFMYTKVKLKKEQKNMCNGKKKNKEEKNIKNMCDGSLTNVYLYRALCNIF